MAKALPRLQRNSLDARFGILGPIGAGQNARIFAAWDRHRDSMVALKTLHDNHGEAISRFKSEFRSLADVSHPNVVQLYDLISDGEIWLMTMELVDGKDLREFQLDATHEEIIDVYESIARGLNAIHESGHVHCDLRPANVRLDPRGRPVLLDFGFIAKVRHASALREGRQTVLGSPTYAAPEVIMGEQPTPASDWYGFATMLFEALLKRPPIRASNINQLLLRKAASDGPALEDVSTEIDLEIARLLVDLLQRDPSKRPDFNDIKDVLGLDSESTTPGPRHIPFVGREGELEHFRQAFDDVMIESAPRFVGLIGPSGIGKSRLVSQFLDECRDVTHFVFESRCHENEHLPFQAIDAIIENIADKLADIEINEQRFFTAGDLNALETVFPAFRRVPSVVAYDGGTVGAGEESRIAAFQALEMTLCAMGRLYPIVFFLDDIQWGDRDSVHFFQHLLAQEKASPDLLIIGACRAHDQQECPFFDILQFGAGTVSFFELEPLDEKEQYRLAAELDFLPQDALGVIQEAQGNPFLLTELARNSALGQPPHESLQCLYRASLSRLSVAERDLVRILALIARPVPLDELIYLLEDREGIQRSITTLKNSRIVRVTRRSERIFVELFHHLIRESVLESLTPRRRLEEHRRIAFGLEAAGKSDPQALYHHYWMAGESEKAGHYALASADQSMEVLAFDHAVRLLRIGLQLKSMQPREHIRRLEQLAECLAHLHLQSESAEAYLQAVQISEDPAQELSLKLRASEQLIAGGNLDEGEPLLWACLIEVGIDPPATHAPLFSEVAKRRARLDGVRADSRGGARGRESSRIDVTWTASKLMANLDVGYGFYFSLVNLEDALAGGDPVHIARALIMKARHEAAVGNLKGGVESALERAETLIAESAQPASVHAMLNHARGCRAQNMGDLDASLDYLGSALQIYEKDCVGASWEASSLRLAHFRPLAATGMFQRARQLGQKLIEHSEAVGDETHAIGARLWAYSYELAADRPDEAEAQANSAIQKWSSRRFYNQHFWHLLSRMAIALYRREPQQAVDLAAANSANIRQTFLMRNPLNRIDLHWRLASAHVCLASRAPKLGPRTECIEAARLEISELRRESIEWAGALADIFEAQLDFLAGGTYRPAGMLRSAQMVFSRYGLHFYAWLAQRRLGMYVGGRAGHEAIAQVDARMRESGVVDPEKLVGMFVSK